MEIKSLVRKFWNLSISVKLVLIWLVLFGAFLLYQFGGARFDSIGSYFSNRAEQRLGNAIDAKTKSADSHKEKAEEWKQTRIKKELEYKERKPQREKVDREAESAKQQLEQAKNEYEKNKALNNSNSDVDIAERERRAIVEAKQLYESGPKNP
jgi:hypothetical protein